MSERKKQVWFRADQAELTVECLKFVRAKLNEGTVLSKAHSVVAGPYTYRRIGEILALFGEPQE